MYICDRLAERERVILVPIFVAIRYVKYPLLFLKNMYQVPRVPGYGYQVRAMFKSLPLNLSRE